MNRSGAKRGGGRPLPPCKRSKNLIATRTLVTLVAITAPAAQASVRSNWICAAGFGILPQAAAAEPPLEMI
jgi:hypothetical protein